MCVWGVQFAKDHNKCILNSDLKWYEMANQILESLFDDQSKFNGKVKVFLTFYFNLNDPTLSLTLSLSLYLSIYLSIYIYIYIYIYENIYKRIIQQLSRFFLINVNSRLFGISL